MVEGTNKHSWSKGVNEECNSTFTRKMRLLVKKEEGV